MATTKKIAFFGATGGCAGYCLANALKSGFDCVALARTPAKLVKAMEDKTVSSEAVKQHLTIIEGNVKDVEAVKKALYVNGQVVDTIISGIGANPTLQWSIREPVILMDNSICQDAGRTILEAAHQLNATQKPLFVNVSTTGISPKGTPRDVPILFTPMYYWLLHVPHEDKRILGEKLAEHVQLPESQRGISGYINVKPSLLMDGEGYGLDAVRQGIDEKPAVGYTIQRGDVGLWMFVHLLQSTPKPEWLNKSVSITY